MNLRAEYEARLVATSTNLLRFLDQSIGIINLAQGGEMPEDEALKELADLRDSWATTLVNDMAPEEHIIKELNNER